MYCSIDHLPQYIICYYDCIYWPNIWWHFFYLSSVEKDMINIFTTMQSFIHGNHRICSRCKETMCCWSRDIKYIQSLCHINFLCVCSPQYYLPGASLGTLIHSWTWYEIQYYCVTFVITRNIVWNLFYCSFCLPSTVNFMTRECSSWICDLIYEHFLW